MFALKLIIFILFCVDKKQDSSFGLLRIKNKNFTSIYFVPKGSILIREDCDDRSR